MQRERLSGRSMVQLVALTFGAVYLLVGVLGLIPFFGGSYTQADNNLLGFVPINLLHNIVHLVIGVAGLAAAASLAASKRYCQVFGIVLIAVGVVGIFASSPLNLLPIGGLDIAIHLVTGSVLAYFGFVTAPAPRGAVAL
jgi:Domain of unknown function (DUF4383)